MPKAGNHARAPGFTSHTFFSPFLLFCLLMVAGCGFTVSPPPLPADPAPVFLLDHGRHSSLVLPAKNSGAVRYSYGDWEWYVLRHTGIAQGSRALFRPSPAALGRRHLFITPSKENVRMAVPVSIENMFLIAVEKKNISRLHSKLEEIFYKNRETLHYSRDFDLDFVRHPEPYTLNNNSNTMVAQWLRELGAEVDGGGLFAVWEIKENP